MLKVECMQIDLVEDELLKFAVILCRYQGQWVFVKHKERDTWEIPGGKREVGEAILDTAKRELYEETGAVDYAIHPIYAYAVVREEKSYGLLCYADVKRMGEWPDAKIGHVACFDEMPAALTYPLIQPVLFEKGKEWLMGAGL